MLNLPKWAAEKRFKLEKGNDQSYFLCTSSISLSKSKIMLKDKVSSPPLILNKEPQNLVVLREIALNYHPQLDKVYLQTLMQRVYSIKAIGKRGYQIINLLIQLLPLPITYYLILKDAPDTVRKPTSSEMYTGIFTLVIELLIIFFFLRFFLTILF